MSEWFSTWFDSKYYHILYKNRDFKEAERFISNVTEQVKLAKSSKVLDLACGKGRHSVYLNQLGFDVVGVDLASNSIEKAKTFETQTLKFDVHDMRDPISFGTFDLIINAFTSFGYFNDPAEDIKTLTHIYHALNPDGIFVFDFLNTHQVVNNLVAEEQKEIEGVTFNITRKFENKSIYKNISFRAEGKDFHFQERVDALTLEDFQKYFDQIGFNIMDVFGDYDLNPYKPQDSKRLILVAKK